jgi:hypothetical protein
MALCISSAEGTAMCRTMQRRRPGERRRAPGKPHSERLVPLDPDAVELVLRLPSMGPRSRAWLVPGRNHSKCNWDELSDVLKVASRDLPDPAHITSHRLRPTFATELLALASTRPARSAARRNRRAWHGGRDAQLGIFDAGQAVFDVGSVQRIRCMRRDLAPRLLARRVKDR